MSAALSHEPSGHLSVTTEPRVLGREFLLPAGSEAVLPFAFRVPLEAPFWKPHAVYVLVELSSLRSTVLRHDLEVTAPERHLRLVDALREEGDFGPPEWDLLLPDPRIRAEFCAAPGATHAHRRAGLRFEGFEESLAVELVLPSRRRGPAAALRALLTGPAEGIAVDLSDGGTEAARLQFRRLFGVLGALPLPVGTASVDPEGLPRPASRSEP